jgi:hypothetical protein
MTASRHEFLRSAGISTIALATPIGVAKWFGHRPFAGVDWHKALVAAGGVHYRACGATLDRPHYTLGRGPGAWPGGYPVFTAAAAGYDNSSGQWLAAIPLHCGGTAGVNVLGVFADTGKEPKYVGKIGQGSKALAFFKDGALHVATARYSEGEAMCSWRRTKVARYDFSSGRPALAEGSILQTAYFREAFGGFLTSNRLLTAA